MRVVEIETQDQQRRYVVIDDEGMLVEPIVRYLKYLDRIGAARNTLCSYAIILKQYWEYLSQQQLDWQQITLDDLAQFILWLKLPTGSLRILPAQPVPQARSNRTINHALAVLSSFYDYHWRMDDLSMNVKEKTTIYLHPRARRYKSFLHHITKGSPVAKNILKQKEEKRQRPPTISKTEVQELLDACSNQRDRLLVWLLYESAMRIGEVLALFVEDVDVAENRLYVRDRGLLENGAEIKTIHAPRTIDVSSELIDEIVSYVGRVHTIEVETNHLFIKLQGAQAGQALTYADVDSLFRRLRRKTSIAVTPHKLRHAYLFSRAWVATGTASGASRACIVSTDLSNVCPSHKGSVTNGLGTDTRASLPHLFRERVKVTMKGTDINLIEGTAALAPLEQLTEEFAKDKWDARLIPGLRYAPHTTNYYIDFQHIPEVFRPVIKEHIKCKLATGVSSSMLHLCTYCLGNFLTFFVKQHAHAQTLQALSKHDIDTFIMALKLEGEAHGWKANNFRIHNHISCLEELLCYLERVQSPLRPTDSIPHIIWPSHYPRLHHPRAQAKYIPQTVLNQLDAHLQHLLPTYIPIVILLRASGWRISDVLYLKLDTCLEQEAEKFWLVGDIMKTRVLGHKIPITKEVASIVLAQIEWVKQHYSAEENPKRWLFPALKTRAGFDSSQRFLHGDPLNAKNVSRALDSLVKKYQLGDEAGNLFHFKLHAFRHTKGIELVNNGMSLLMVQQWMAHASPEMTLIYAKILDDTMRTQWEKAVQHGIVQFNEGKPEYVPGKKMLTVLQESQAFDPERVRNYRANTKLPVGNCVKSPKLICKFTELPCFHCPAYVLTPDDLPALETYEQQILERIEIGKQANNTYWIEVNQKNLDERVRPAIAMLKQGQIVAKSEKYEREYTQEEWEQQQAQQHVQEEAHE